VALNATTGRILWQTADPQQAADLGYVSTANGLMYVGSTAATGDDMHVIDAASGKILWSFASGGSVSSGASIVHGTVYWGSGYCRATRCPNGTGTMQVCVVSNDKLYAFTLHPFTS
jgi:polyvinyl alcohol dehydrogenase (cytochrome)